MSLLLLFLVESSHNCNCWIILFSSSLYTLLIGFYLFYPRIIFVISLFRKTYEFEIDKLISAIDFWPPFTFLNTKFSVNNCDVIYLGVVQSRLSRLFKNQFYSIRYVLLNINCSHWYPMWHICHIIFRIGVFLSRNFN